MSQAKSGDAKWDDMLVEMQALHDQLNIEPPQAPATAPTLKDPVLGTLVDKVKSDGFVAWPELHALDLRLIGLMPDPIVCAQFANRSATATKAGVATPALTAEFQKAGQTDDGRRAVLIELAKNIQAAATLKRVNRKAKAAVTGKLNKIALWLFVTPIALLAIYLYFVGLAGAAGRVHLAAVVWFGAIGAYMSRIIALQSADIDYDELVSGFSAWGLIIRLIFGGTAALILYLMIAGQLLGGDIFPAKDFAAFTRKIPLGDGWLTAVPSADFAKLLVWSTIAGFSERLVPEQFTRLQGMVPNK
ncbi:hypothetical protein OIU35_10885 [Boseaceae bacterium BT-24-1]|nr:hypothetical protein [Boseaceae bacterium BT-24-1]